MHNISVRRAVRASVVAITLSIGTPVVVADNASKSQPAAPAQPGTSAGTTAAPAAGPDRPRATHSAHAPSPPAADPRARTQHLALPRRPPAGAGRRHGPHVP